MSATPAAKFLTRLAGRAAYWNTEGRTAPEYTAEAHEYAHENGFTAAQVADLMLAAYEHRTGSEAAYIAAADAILATR